MFGNEAEDIFGGMIFEGSQNRDRKIFEEAADAGSIDDFATKQTRSQAMACVLGWIDGGDFSFGALADLAAGIADLDGDEEFSDDEEAFYNDLLTEVGYALTALGADADNVQTFIDDEDDAAGAKMGAFLADKMQSVEEDDETLITNYAVSNAPIMESMIKVVRAGKVVLKKKRLRKVKLSAAQKAGLKIARRRAFTGAAKLKRKKSMKIRRKRGL
jgi:hypothetical protein